MTSSNIGIGFEMRDYAVDVDSDDDEEEMVNKIDRPRLYDKNKNKSHNYILIAIMISMAIIGYLIYDDEWWHIPNPNAVNAHRLSVGDFSYIGNFGKTTKQQKYILIEMIGIYGEGYQYKKDSLSSNEWSIQSPLLYLVELFVNGSYGTPSVGLRSNPALGPFGQGTIGLRADGSFVDVTIYNNGPNAQSSSFSHKLDLNDALFGFSFRSKSNIDSISKILQTAPIDDKMKKYSVDSLSYSASYPTSRIQAIDNDWKENIGINYVNLTVFSSFEPHNENMSSIPGIIFWFDIDNKNNGDNVEMDFFFNWQDVINFDNININRNLNGIFMNKIFDKSDAKYFSSGNMSFTLQKCNRNTNECNIPINKSYKSVANTLYQNWMIFTQNQHYYNRQRKNDYDGHRQNHGFISNNIVIAANTIYSFCGILSWYFPYRTFNNNTQHLGNYYNNFYKSSNDVNDDILNKLPLIISNILSWQRLFDLSTNKLYPTSLKDIFVNSPNAISRTGFFLESDINGTGIWRQFESFSCKQVDPPHIHGYRSLAYNMLFNNVLERGTLNMYTYNQINNGLVSELFGGGCTKEVRGKMGKTGGTDKSKGGIISNERGDDNSIYILNMYLQFKWYKDGEKYVNERYKYIKDAMNWIIRQSISNGYGLPYRLHNTFDEHRTMGDVNTYSSMLYISALYAMRIMTKYYEPQNRIYYDKLNNVLLYANGNLTNLLWVQTNDANNGFFRSFWCENGRYPKYGLQSDVMYGFLWSLILDLDEYWSMNIKNYVISHIKQEKVRNLSKYGLKFLTNRTTVAYDCGDTVSHYSSFLDRDTWEMATIDNAVLSLYLLHDDITDIVDSLSMIELIFNKYRNLYVDQWDFRDLSSTHNNDSNPSYSRPVCNSHYSRQLIYYSSFLALNGQKINVDPNTNKLELKLKPIISINNNDCIPVLIPKSIFLLCLKNDKNNQQYFEINCLFGKIIIDSLIITNSEKRYNFTNILLQKNDVTKLVLYENN